MSQTMPTPLDHLVGGILMRENSTAVTDSTFSGEPIAAKTLILRPPWTFPERAHEREGKNGNLLAIPFIDVDYFHWDRQAEATIPGIRQVSTTGVLRWTLSTNPMHHLKLQRLADRYAVDGVVWGESISSTLVRDQLTDAMFLGKKVSCWFYDHGYLRERGILSLVSEVVDATVKCRTLQGACRDLGICSRRLRRQVRAIADVGPGTIIALSVGMRIGLELQRHPREPVDSVASRLGWSVEGLCSQLRRTFVCTPAGARKMLGARQLLSRWSTASLHKRVRS